MVITSCNIHVTFACTCIQRCLYSSNSEALCMFGLHVCVYVIYNVVVLFRVSIILIFVYAFHFCSQ